MKRPPELTRITRSLREFVNHGEDVLGYKVKFKTSEVKEALQDLGYVLDYRPGSRKEKVFYRLSANSNQAGTPADENTMLDEVGGYILSRKESERYWQQPEGRENEPNKGTSPRQHEPSAESNLEKLFFSYPDKIFLRDLEEDEPEATPMVSGRTKYWGKIALNAGIAAATVFCVYLLAREMPAAKVISPSPTSNYDSAERSPAEN